MFSLTSIQAPSQECAPNEPALLALPSRHRGAFLPRRVFFSALQLRYLSHPARPVPFEWPLIVRAGNIGAGTYPWIPWFRRQFSWSIPAIRCDAPTFLKPFGLVPLGQRSPEFLASRQTQDARWKRSYRLRIRDLQSVQSSSSVRSWVQGITIRPWLLLDADVRFSPRTPLSAVSFLPPW